MHSADDADMAHRGTDPRAEFLPGCDEETSRGQTKSPTVLLISQETDVENEATCLTESSIIVLLQIP